MAAQSRNIAELENASVWRLLIQYSLPSIAGMVVYSLYNIIDSVFIGHGVGPLALSGLAVTFPIMNLTFALGTLVGIGGAAISSIRLGRKDQEGTERTLGNVLIMSLIAAVVLVIPTLLFLTEILTAFGASGQTLTYAYDFMLITLLGLPVTYVFFNLNHVMRATGYPKKAMGSTLLSVGINIILAPIFIFWFKWGITGAAVATLLAQVVGMVRVLLHFSDAASTVHFRRGIYRLRGKIDRHGGVDILVTHAPLHGYGDMTDLPHRGFTAFSVLLDRYHPQLMLHGHIHLNYGCSIPREQQYGATRIVNCYERVYLDVDAPAPKPRPRLFASLLGRNAL